MSNRAFTFVVALGSLAMGFLIWKPTTILSTQIYTTADGSLVTDQMEIFELMSDANLRSSCLGQKPLTLTSDSSQLKKHGELTITGIHSIAACIFRGRCSQWSCVQTDQMAVAH